MNEKDIGSLTYSQSFNAMADFIEQYWRRGGGSSDDIAVLLGSMNRGNDNGMPLDPALWYDWLEACKSIEKTK